jgi:polyisoprenoid-binding protein YceI
LASTWAVALLVACAPLPPQRGSAPTRAIPATFPARHYDAVASAGRPMFTVEPGHSVVVVEVHRGGSLARLGHDHVVASHDVRGCIAPADGRADFYVRLQDLTVDEPPLRAAAGFDTQPTPADVAATRENMLDKVLHTEPHPFAEIGIVRVEGDGKAVALDLALTLNGVTRTQRIGAEVEIGADAMRVTGRTVIRQSDFGIVPFSILNGAIRVEDPVEVRFEILARRAPPASGPAPQAGACSASVG